MVTTREILSGYLYCCLLPQCDAQKSLSEGVIHLEAQTEANFFHTNEYHQRLQKSVGTTIQQLFEPLFGLNIQAC